MEIRDKNVLTPLDFRECLEIIFKKVQFITFTNSFINVFGSFFFFLFPLF